jgi:hypothetical protein
MFSFIRNVPKLWCAEADVATSTLATSNPQDSALIVLSLKRCRARYYNRTGSKKPVMSDSTEPKAPEDVLPDVRDGLTREERIVLYVLHETQKERGGRNVPTAMLWGRVCEHFYISPEELSDMLARLGARK